MEFNTIGPLTDRSGLDGSDTLLGRISKVCMIIITCVVGIDVVGMTLLLGKVVMQSPNFKTPQWE